MSSGLARGIAFGIVFGGLRAAFGLDTTQTQIGSEPTTAPGVTAPVATGGGVNGVSPAGGTTASTTASPAGSGTLADEITDLKRFFTITADVREEYDDNIYTTSDPKVASFKEEITPSILFSYPMDNSTFDARYTFGLTYYNHSPTDQHTDQDHDIVLRYNHSFSDRFNIDLRDDGGYHEDPSLLNSIGTVNRVGGYYDNIFTGEFTAQWTPLFGTITSYSNNFIEYEDSDVGTIENSDENTISQDFRFAFWPTVTLAFGLIYDNIEYFDSSRGYSNYTANTGLDWQALPSLSLGFRVGGSLTEFSQGSGSSTTPYASANVNWQLGERSRLIGSYEHTVTPSDISYAEGEQSDRFSANFLYNVTPDITTHLEGVFTRGEYNDEFINASGSGGVTDFSENVAAFDTGVTYHYNQYLDFEAGYVFSIVDAQAGDTSYTRNQIYLGVRGTY